ncbi:MAG TPA: hypothetical protein PLI95_00825 [Polyangiaceae bacterium]|nr:hypothetical protein [Polyangiaceae bacterium]
MPTLEDLSALKNENIRKALRGFIAVAKMGVIPPTAITTSPNSQLLPLSVGWNRLGNLSKQSGLSFQRQTDSSEVESWGQAEPTRIDFTKDVTNVTYECQETKRATLEQYYQVDLSALVPDASTGEVAFAQPTVLRKIYNRIIFVAADGYGEDEIYIAKLLPKFSVSSVADSSWSENDPMVYGITGTAMVDSALGFSVKHFFGGPGWKKQLISAGFKSTYTLTIPSGATGNFGLKVNGVATSTTLTEASTGADIETALNGLVTVGASGSTGSGAAGGPYTIALVNGGDLSVVPGTMTPVLS